MVEMGKKVIDLYNGSTIILSNNSPTLKSLTLTGFGRNENVGDVEGRREAWVNEERGRKILSEGSRHCVRLLGHFE